MGFNITPVVRNLLLINVLVFAVGAIFRINMAEEFGLRYIFSDSFNPVQIPAHIFIHGDIMHLFSNMLGLFVFGPMLEQYLGPKRFLSFYLICGYGASLLFGIVNYIEVSSVQAAVQEFIMAPSPDDLNQLILKHTPGYLAFEEGIYNFVNIDYAGAPNDPQFIGEAKGLARAIFNGSTRGVMVGASGAILGVVIGFAYLFPNVELMLIFPPMPVKAKYVALIYAGYDIYSMIQNRPDDNVAHLAHIGGMIFAILLLKIWKVERPRYL